MIDLILEVFGQLAVDQVRKNQPSQETGPLPVKGSPRLRSLERDHERLKLITMALWEMVAERLQIDEEELRRRVLELDRIDGREDGRLRVKGPPRECRACGRTMLKSAAACPYCGEQSADLPLFP